MEGKTKTTRLNTWMIIGIIFGVISVALGVILAFTYVNMPNRDEISAEAYEEAKAEYKDQVAQLRQYYELRLKRNNLKNDTETEKPEDADVEPEDGAYNELYDIDPVVATTTKDYVYIPSIGKKLKIGSGFKNVKYSTFSYGTCIWAVVSDAPADEYSFTYKNGLSTPLVTLNITSSDYIDAILKIDTEDEWYSGLKKNAILYSGGNYLNVSADDPYSSGDEELSDEEQSWFKKSQEALLKLVKNKNNYEDIE